MKWNFALSAFYLPTDPVTGKPMVPSIDILATIDWDRVRECPTPPEDAVYARIKVNFDREEFSEQFFVSTLVNEGAFSLSELGVALIDTVPHEHIEIINEVKPVPVVFEENPGESWVTTTEVVVGVSSDINLETNIQDYSLFGSVHTLSPSESCECAKNDQPRNPAPEPVTKKLTAKIIVKRSPGIPKTR